MCVLTVEEQLEVVFNLNLQSLGISMSHALPRRRRYHHIEQESGCTVAALLLLSILVIVMTLYFKGVNKKADQEGLATAENIHFRLIY
jgi:hypothetical protein